jgi:hypothetical protein
MVNAVYAIDDFPGELQYERSVATHKSAFAWRSFPPAKRIR